MHTHAEKLIGASKYISEAIADIKYYRFDRNRYENTIRLSENSLVFAHLTAEQKESMKQAQEAYDASDAKHEEWRVDEIIRLLNQARRHIKELFKYA